jgi:hypothetical protein
MTPKEKAKDLVSKYVHLAKQSTGPIGTIYNAKQCALIAVNEILQSLGYKKLSDSPYTTLEARQYYVEVKQEIELL